jgi:hypothetical protein
MMYNFLLTFLIIAALTALYYLILIIRSGKKVSPVYKGTDVRQMKMKDSLIPSYPPQLIDLPSDRDQTVIPDRGDRSPAPEVKFESVDDHETLLLKAAEVVVEKIQDIVNHIASTPPNVEEVFSKIRAIVHPYTIFHNTEYFDAINSFIAITIERDCSIQFTKQQLLDIWK